MQLIHKKARPAVFIPEPIAKCGLELLRPECNCLVPWEDSGDISVDPANPASGAQTPDRGTPPNPSPGRKRAEDGQDSHYREALYEADAVIVRLFKISERDLQRANRLKVIAKHGVGVDNIDCQAATTRGIPVVHTPTANSNAVAEHTLALMLALSRQIDQASAALKAGWFSERSRFQGVELAGKTLVIIGLGRIGARVARMAALGLEMTVYAYDPFLPKADYSGPAIIEDSLDSLLPKADFLSIHVPLTPDTKHIINARSLRLVKPGCRIINTSRGAVIDEAALALALKQGTLAGAALDVFEEEPLPANHPLCYAPNTLLTPHISSSTEESLKRMSLQAAQGILDVLHGRTPEHVVNPETLVRF